MSESGASSAERRASTFPTTHWSAVLAAGRADSAEGFAALERLCGAYWYPLYAYVRRRGYGPEEAQDLTQEFFHRFIEKNYLAQVAREKGRFRSFMLAALQHFLSDERDKAHAQKRGGGLALIPIETTQTAEDLYRLEPADPESPDRLFERRWAMTVLERAAARLRESYAADGKGVLYEKLKVFLSGDKGVPSYAEVAAQLDLGESALKSALHRLRQR